MLAIPNGEVASFDGMPTRVTIDPAGRFWVLGGRTVTVLDSTGRSLGSIATGRDSSQSFRYPFDVVPVGDSLLVIDPPNRVAVVLDSKLRWIRDVPFGAPVERLIVLRWPDLLVGTGRINTPDAVGLYLHRLALEAGSGSVLESFGSSDGQLFAGDTRPLSERAVADGKGGFYSFLSGSYTIHHWDADLKRRETIERRPTWFQTPREPTLGGPAIPPTPRFVGLEVDTSGLLWTYFAVPKSTWDSAWPKLGTGIVEIPIKAIGITKMFATMVEVLDPHTKRVVARQLFDETVIESLPGHRAATYSVDDQGREVVTVVRLEMSRPSIAGARRR